MPNIPAIYDGSVTDTSDSGAGRANPPAMPAPDATSPERELDATTNNAPDTAPQIDYQTPETLTPAERSIKADNWGTKVYHGVLNALGGGGDVAYQRDPNTGKMVATPVATGPGTQWKKIIAGGMAGFSAAASAQGTGPGSTMRAAGAGTAAGLKMGVEQDDRARGQADQDFEENQKAMTAQAQRSLLSHQVAESTFRLGRDQVTAAAEDAERETNFEKVIQAGGEGSRDMGVFPDFPSVIKAFKEAPELHDHHAAGRMVAIPHINGKGNVDGIRAALVTQTWLESKINRDLPIVTRTYKDGKVQEQTFTVPAGSLTGAEYTSMVQAQSNQSLENFTKVQDSKSRATEAGAQASQAAENAKKTPSEIAKNDAQAALDNAKALAAANGMDEVNWGPNGQKGFQSWHDKNVTPAMQAERTYRLASNVYNEYKALRKQGKDFPTGAQSVQMLSYHMANTFGNVKGARITKDLIQKHMGARSISDSALVAIQKLTNGEQLSPSQWDAYFSMVGQNRDETWRSVLDDATAMQRPTDYIAFPQDLRQRWDLGPGHVRPALTGGQAQGGGQQPKTGGQAQPKGSIKLTDARNLPQFKGMTDDQITAAAKQWNYTVE
jgi:hypothetical protein